MPTPAETLRDAMIADVAAQIAALVLPVAPAQARAAYYMGLATAIVDNVTGGGGSGYTTCSNNGVAVTSRSTIFVDGTLLHFADVADTTVLTAPGYTPTSRQVNAGTGLSGGGSLTGDLTISMPNTGPGAGSYAYPTNITLDAQGRVTAVTVGSAPVTQAYTTAVNNTTSLTQRSKLQVDGTLLQLSDDSGNSQTQLTAPGLVPATRTITAGTGLSGGGDLSANRTISLPNTGPGAGTVAYPVSLTLDAQGRVTAASGGSAPVTQAYSTIDGNGSGVTQRSTLNFSSAFSVADNSGSSRTDVDLAASGVTASTYTSVTVDAYGRVTAGTNPGFLTQAYTTAVNNTTSLTQRSKLQVDGTLLQLADDSGNSQTKLTAPGLVPATRTITAGTGLSGGGDLSANRTVSMPSVGPGATTTGGGSSYILSVQTDAQGRIVALTTGTPTGSGGGGAIPAVTTVADTTHTSSSAEIVHYTSLSAARVVTGTTGGSTGSPIWVIIKDGSGSASLTNTISFTPSSGTVDGLSTIVAVNTPYGSAQFYCDGTNWWSF